MTSNLLGSTVPTSVSSLPYLKYTGFTGKRGRGCLFVSVYVHMMPIYPSSPPHIPFRLFMSYLTSSILNFLLSIAHTGNSLPTPYPTYIPTFKPTGQPSRQPTRQPSTQPTNPTGQPSRQPSEQPSRQPSRQPTAKPSKIPSKAPTHAPTYAPTPTPTSRPTWSIFLFPTEKPVTESPSPRPSFIPTKLTGTFYLAFNLSLSLTYSLCLNFLHLISSSPSCDHTM